MSSFNFHVSQTRCFLILVGFYCAFFGIPVHAQPTAKDPSAIIESAREARPVVMRRLPVVAADASVSYDADRPLLTTEGRQSVEVRVGEAKTSGDSAIRFRSAARNEAQSMRCDPGKAPDGSGGCR